MAESQAVLPAAAHPALLLVEGYVVTLALMAVTVRIRFGGSVRSLVSDLSSGLVMHWQPEV